jgi:hypothetical protein
MTQTDPGVTGKKLSKSNDDTLERRNKSYEKVLDAQIAWIRASQSWTPDSTCVDGVWEVETLHTKWKKKSEWHEKEFGW